MKFKLVVMLAGLGALMVVLFSARTTLALPAYTPATGQACGVCHVNPAGGGPLTASGQAFAAIPTHTTDPAGAWAQVSQAAATPTTAPPAATPTTAPPAATATTAPPAATPTTAAPATPTAAAPAATPTAAAPAATPTRPPATATPATPVTLPGTGDNLPAGLVLLGAGLLVLLGFGLHRFSRQT